MQPRRADAHFGMGGLSPSIGCVYKATIGPGLICGSGQARWPKEEHKTSGSVLPWIRPDGCRNAHKSDRCRNAHKSHLPEEGLLPWSLLSFGEKSQCQKPPRKVAQYLVLPGLSEFLLGELLFPPRSSILIAFTSSICRLNSPSHPHPHISLPQRNSRGK